LSKASPFSDNPILTNQTVKQDWTDDVSILPLSVANIFTDPQGLALTYTVSLNGQTVSTTSPLDGLTFDGTSLTGTPDVTGKFTLKVTATDSSGLSNSEDVSITINPQKPIVANQTAPQTWTAGTSIGTLSLGNVFAPQTETLTYSATLDGKKLSAGNPVDGITFSGTTLSGTPDKIGPMTVKVTATDDHGQSTSETFTADVNPGKPVVGTVTADQSWTAGQKIQPLSVAGAFTDPQGEKLSYAATVNGQSLSATTAVDGLTLVGSNIEGTPTTTGTLALQVTAMDSAGQSGSESFSAVVGLGTPLLAQVTPAQKWTSGSAITPLSLASVFTDPQGLTMTYAVTIGGQALNATTPVDGLTLNGTTISGTPTAVGTLSVQVTATDTAGQSNSETFSAVVGKPVVVVTTSASPVTATAATAQTEGVQFDGSPATLVLSGPFSASTFIPISGLTLGDVIDLAATTATSAKHAGDSLFLYNGTTVVAEFEVSKLNSKYSFITTSDGNGGTLLELSTHSNHLEATLAGHSGGMTSVMGHMAHGVL
jgi:hypothetical protein